MLDHGCKLDQGVCVSQPEPELVFIMGSPARIVEPAGISHAYMFPSHTDYDHTYITTDLLKGK